VCVCVCVCVCVGVCVIVIVIFRVLQLFVVTTCEYPIHQSKPRLQVTNTRTDIKKRIQPKPHKLRAIDRRIRATATFALLINEHFLHKYVLTGWMVQVPSLSAIPSNLPVVLSTVWRWFLLAVYSLTEDAGFTWNETVYRISITGTFGMAQAHTVQFSTDTNSSSQSSFELMLPATVQ
jgi:hypothetical protein